MNFSAKPGQICSLYVCMYMCVCVCVCIVHVCVLACIVKYLLVGAVSENKRNLVIYVECIAILLCKVRLGMYVLCVCKCM